jgi:hypothetical protein
MKASEFIDKMFWENSYSPKINNDGSNLSLIKKQMNERFIDREELTEIITQRINDYDKLEEDGLITAQEKMCCIKELYLILKVIK